MSDYLKEHKKRVLLTGGNGLVGKNIQNHVKAKEWDIIAPPRKELDLMDAVSVYHWLEKYKPYLIIHAAGLVGGIKANIANSVDFLDTNLVIGRNIIMGAKDCNVMNFINLGSSCMYPKSISGSLTEDMLMTGKLEQTNEGYALAKLLTTKLCQYINQINIKMQYKTLIPCNIYGKHDNFDPINAHLLPAIINKIHRAKIDKLGTVTIWGKGDARREFLYAEDLADAILRAADDMKKVPSIMNIGVGLDHTVNEYYKMVAEVLNWQGKFEHDLNMPVGISQKLNSIQKQIEWGWVPQTPLKVGIKKVYSYFLENPVQ